MTTDGVWGSFYEPALWFQSTFLYHNDSLYTGGPYLRRQRMFRRGTRTRVSSLMRQGGSRSRPAYALPRTAPYHCPLSSIQFISDMISAYCIYSIAPCLYWNFSLYMPWRP
jgi:hypothetical protein